MYESYNSEQAWFRILVLLFNLPKKSKISFRRFQDTIDSIESIDTVENSYMNDTRVKIRIDIVESFEMLVSIESIKSIYRKK